MDLDYQDLRSPEFQAVIIVDYDDGRLFPLTENTPKCLLPIANRKLLAYQLDMLAKSGVVGKDIHKYIMLCFFNLVHRNICCCSC
jgi:hypothetical protein